MSFDRTLTPYHWSWAREGAAVPCLTHSDAVSLDDLQVLARDVVGTCGRTGISAEELWFWLFGLESTGVEQCICSRLGVTSALLRAHLLRTLESDPDIRVQTQVTAQVASARGKGAAASAVTSSSARNNSSDSGGGGGGGGSAAEKAPSNVRYVGSQALRLDCLGIFQRPSKCLPEPGSKDHWTRDSIRFDVLELIGCMRWAGMTTTALTQTAKWQSKTSKKSIHHVLQELDQLGLITSTKFFRGNVRCQRLARFASGPWQLPPDVPHPQVSSHLPQSIMGEGKKTLPVVVPFGVHSVHPCPLLNDNAMLIEWIVDALKQAKGGVLLGVQLCEKLNARSKQDPQWQQPILKKNTWRECQKRLLSMTAASDVVVPFERGKIKNRFGKEAMAFRLITSVPEGADAADSAEASRAEGAGPGVDAAGATADASMHSNAAAVGDESTAGVAAPPSSSSTLSSSASLTSSSSGAAESNAEGAGAAAASATPARTRLPGIVPHLTMREHILWEIYARGSEGLTKSELVALLQQPPRKLLDRLIRDLVQAKAISFSRMLMGRQTVMRYFSPQAHAAREKKRENERTQDDPLRPWLKEAIESEGRPAFHNKSALRAVVPVVIKTEEDPGEKTGEGKGKAKAKGKGKGKTASAGQPPASVPKTARTLSETFLRRMRKVMYLIKAKGQGVMTRTELLILCRELEEQQGMQHRLDKRTINKIGVELVARGLLKRVMLENDMPWRVSLSAPEKHDIMIYVAVEVSPDPSAEMIEAALRRLRSRRASLSKKGRQKSKPEKRFRGAVDVDPTQGARKRRRRGKNAVAIEVGSLCRVVIPSDLQDDGASNMGLASVRPLLIVGRTGRVLEVMKAGWFRVKLNPCDENVDDDAIAGGRIDDEGKGGQDGRTGDQANDKTATSTTSTSSSSSSSSNAPGRSGSNGSGSSSSSDSGVAPSGLAAGLAAAIESLKGACIVKLRASLIQLCDGSEQSSQSQPSLRSLEEVAQKIFLARKLRSRVYNKASQPLPFVLSSMYAKGGILRLTELHAFLWRYVAGTLSALRASADADANASTEATVVRDLATDAAVIVEPMPDMIEFDLTAALCLMPVELFFRLFKAPKGLADWIGSDRGVGSREAQMRSHVLDPDARMCDLQEGIGRVLVERVVRERRKFINHLVALGAVQVVTSHSRGTPSHSRGTLVGPRSAPKGKGKKKGESVDGAATASLAKQEQVVGMNTKGAVRRVSVSAAPGIAPQLSEGSTRPHVSATVDLTGDDNAVPTPTRPEAEAAVAAAEDPADDAKVLQVVAARDSTAKKGERLQMRTLLVLDLKLPVQAMDSRARCRHCNSLSHRLARSRACPCFDGCVPTCRLAEHFDEKRDGPHVDPSSASRRMRAAEAKAARSKSNRQWDIEFTLDSMRALRAYWRRFRRAFSGFDGKWLSTRLLSRRHMPKISNTKSWLESAATAASLKLEKLERANTDEASASATMDVDDAGDFRGIGKTTAVVLARKSLKQATKKRKRYQVALLSKNKGKDKGSSRGSLRGRADAGAGASGGEDDANADDDRVSEYAYPVLPWDEAMDRDLMQTIAEERVKALFYLNVPTYLENAWDRLAEVWTAARRRRGDHRTVCMADLCAAVVGKFGFVARRRGHTDWQRVARQVGQSAKRCQGRVMWINATAISTKLNTSDQQDLVDAVNDSVYLGVHRRALVGLGGARTEGAKAGAGAAAEDTALEAVEEEAEVARIVMGGKVVAACQRVLQELILGWQPDVAATERTARGYRKRRKKRVTGTIMATEPLPPFDKKDVTDALLRLWAAGLVVRVTKATTAALASGRMDTFTLSVAAERFLAGDLGNPLTGSFPVQIKTRTVQALMVQETSPKQFFGDAAALTSLFEDGCVVPSSGSSATSASSSSQKSLSPASTPASAGTAAVASKFPRAIQKNISYNLFVKEEVPKVRDESKAKKLGWSSNQIIHEVGRRWHALDDEKRARYDNAFDAEKERYARELAAYMATNPDFGMNVELVAEGDDMDWEREAYEAPPMMAECDTSEAVGLDVSSISGGTMATVLSCLALGQINVDPILQHRQKDTAAAAAEDEDSDEEEETELIYDRYGNGYRYREQRAGSDAAGSQPQPQLLFKARKRDLPAIHVDVDVVEHGSESVQAAMVRADAGSGPVTASHRDAEMETTTLHKGTTRNGDDSSTKVSGPWVAEAQDSAGLAGLRTAQTRRDIGAAVVVDVADAAEEEQEGSLISGGDVGQVATTSSAEDEKLVRGILLSAGVGGLTLTETFSAFIDKKPLLRRSGGADKIQQQQTKSRIAKALVALESRGDVVVVAGHVAHRFVHTQRSGVWGIRSAPGCVPPHVHVIDAEAGKRTTSDEPSGNTATATAAAAGPAAAGATNDTRMWQWQTTCWTSSRTDQLSFDKNTLRSSRRQLVSAALGHAGISEERLVESIPLVSRPLAVDLIHSLVAEGILTCARVPVPPKNLFDDACWGDTDGGTENCRAYTASVKAIQLLGIKESVKEDKEDVAPVCDLRWILDEWLWPGAALADGELASTKAVVRRRRSTRRQRRKNPLWPKKALSAYSYFMKRQRPAVQKDLGPGSTVQAIVREVARRWQALEPEHRQEYDALAAKDKTRYEAEASSAKLNGVIQWLA